MYLYRIKASFFFYTDFFKTLLQCKLKQDMTSFVKCRTFVDKHAIGF